VIATVMRVAWLNLRRDRVALALTYLLPLLFFSIFALVFGSQGRGGQVRPQRVALADEDASEASRAFAAALGKEEALRLVTQAPPRQAEPGAAAVPLDRPRAEALVRDGDVALAVVLPAGFGAALGDFAARPRVLLLSDPANPLTAPLVEGLLQKTAATAQPDRQLQSGLAMFEKHAGAMTPGQRQAVDAWLARPRAAGSPGAAAAAAALVDTELVPVLGERGRDTSLIAFYAAGIGVMFLLFSASAAGGSLIEEVESGTLERLLTSPLGMGRLLVGKWLFIAAMGILQVSLMFAWGAVAFGLALRPHLPGFALMTLFTAAAAAAFGLVLATACRSRAQLGGISSIVILMMSALGGSMFPRFLMSEGMQRLGLLTFNGWALDGYIKVFWRRAPLVELWPQLVVLGTLCVVFLAAARRLARRWEIA
jgi:ABC-2 type transport system permease protein